MKPIGLNPLRALLVWARAQWWRLLRRVRSGRGSPAPVPLKPDLARTIFHPDTNRLQVIEATLRLASFATERRLHPEAKLLTEAARELAQQLGRCIS
jgi:hypothetical protein